MTAIKGFTSRKAAPSLKRQLAVNTGKARPGFLKREFTQARDTLRYQNRSGVYPVTVIFCILLALAGFFTGLFLGNVLLAPVLAAGLGLIPIWKVKLSRRKYDLYLSDVLFGGLSLITTSYIGKNNFISAVESNLNYLNEPLRATMRDFLNIVTYVEPSIAGSIELIRPRIQNEIWEKWCDGVIQCQKNHTLRPGLTRTLDALSKIKEAQSDYNREMDKSFKGFLILIGFVLAVFPIYYFVNPTWFGYLFTTLPGQAAVLFAAVVLVASLAKLVSLLKPIHYRR